MGCLDSNVNGVEKGRRCSCIKTMASCGAKVAEASMIESETMRWIKKKIVNK